MKMSVKQCTGADPTHRERVRCVWGTMNNTRFELGLRTNLKLSLHINLLHLLSYDLRKSCNLIGWKQWYFSVTVVFQALRSDISDDQGNANHKIQDGGFSLKKGWKNHLNQLKKNSKKGWPRQKKSMGPFI